MSSVNIQISQILLNASSADSQIRREAEVKLKEWEKTPNFYPTLLELTFDKTIDLNARSLSIIYMKNGIEKYWRIGSSCCLPLEEKNIIRQTILKIFQEEDNSIARQLAVVIAKIARIDYPNNWPNLIEIILQAINSNEQNPNPKNRLISFRGLTLLNQVIKQLCSNRLLTSRRILEMIAPEIFYNTMTQFVQNINVFINKISEGNSDESTINNYLEFTLYSLKCCKKIVVYGFNNINKESAPCKFFNVLLGYMTKLLEIYNLLKEPSPYIESLFSILLNCGKIFLGIQKYHPVQFALMERCPEIISWYYEKIISYKRNGNIEYEKLLIQGMLLIKDLVKNPVFTPSTKGEAAQNKDLITIKNLLENVIFVPDFVKALSEVLIFNYLKLSEEDLNNWEFNAESFICDEDSQSWEFQIRTCAEKLFMVLFSVHNKHIAPKILEYIQQASQINDQADMDSILIKDAIYATIGLGAYEFYNIVDFDSWFNGQLYQEGQNKSPKFVIIRRRIAWLCTKWIGVKISKEIRPKIYELLISLLVPEEDLVVRLTAVIAIHYSVDDWDFEIEKFLPYLETIIDLNIKLITEVEEFDCRIKIVNCLSVIVERIGSKITPYAEKIINLLPQLWDIAGDQNLFKSSILVILTKLVTSLRQSSMKIYGMIIPVIRSSVDTSSNSHIYLLEDGLELWKATIDNSSECTPELINLFPYLLNLMEFGTESLKIVLNIVESYIVLSPIMVFQQYAEQLFNGLSNILVNSKFEIIKNIVRIIDLSLQVCSRDQCFSSIANVITASSLLEKMLQAILKGDDLAIVIIEYLAIYARIMLYDVNIFISLMQHFGQKCNPPQESLIKPLINIFVERIDNIGHPKKRKLVALALSNILPILNQDTIDQLQGIFAVISDVLTEVKESGKKDSLVYWYEETVEPEDEESLDSRRRNELLKIDPIHTINLFDFFKLKLSELENIAGGHEQFNKLILSNIDQIIVQQIYSLIY